MLHQNRPWVWTPGLRVTLGHLGNPGLILLAYKDLCWLPRQLSYTVIWTLRLKCEQPGQSPKGQAKARLNTAVCMRPPAREGHPAKDPTTRPASSAYTVLHGMGYTSKHQVPPPLPITSETLPKGKNNHDFLKALMRWVGKDVLLPSMNSNHRKPMRSAAAASVHFFQGKRQK